MAKKCVCVQPTKKSVPLIKCRQKTKPPGNSPWERLSVRGKAGGGKEMRVGKKWGKGGSDYIRDKCWARKTDCSPPHFPPTLFFACGFACAGDPNPNFPPTTVMVGFNPPFFPTPPFLPPFTGNRKKAQTPPPLLLLYYYYYLGKGNECARKSGRNERFDGKLACCLKERTRVNSSNQTLEIVGKKFKKRKASNFAWCLISI